VEARQGGRTRGRGAGIAPLSGSGLSLRVVGSSSSIPRPNRACSCYLLQTPATSIALDFGTGALAKIQETLSYGALDAVVITHMHADHFLDVIPLRYALKYGIPNRDRRTPLWLPPNGERILRSMGNALARDSAVDFFDEVFDVREYDPKTAVTIGDFTLTFAPAIHYIEAYAIRAQYGATSVAYSADTAPSDAVARLASACSLFICEATLGLETEEGPDRGHLNAYEAGQLAHTAGAQRLLITHYGAECIPAELEAAAAETFVGPCNVADDGITFIV